MRFEPMVKRPFLSQANSLPNATETASANFSKWFAEISMDNEQPLWKRKIAPFVRAVIPRGVRNFLRRPRMTAKRLKAKAAFYMGRVARVKMRGGWELRCHPICQESFQVFANDPL